MSSQPWTKTGFFANLTNGVSQQSERVRLDSQQDEVINCYPTTHDQMGQRPPLEIVSELAGLHSWLDIPGNGYPHRHQYVRDANEAYEIFFDGDGGLRVYDRATGVQKTVTIASSDSYLTSASPETGFFCLTYKDTTFVANRSVTVAMESTLSTSRNSEALIRVRDYASGYTYSVTLTINATTITVTPTGTDVNTVASDIKADIEASGSWAAISATTTITVYSNTVHITNTTHTVILKVSDNRAGTAISSFTNEALTTQDLTKYAPDGYRVRVTGTSSTAAAKDQNTADDQYYVFEADDNSGGSGKWVETVAPGIKYIIDQDTAPHTLVRNSDGTFTFDAIDWGTRDVGDLETNPDPLIVGQTVYSIYLLGNRLNFVSGNGFLGSRVGEENYYQLMRSTTSATLDDDPVYGTVPSAEVSNIYHPIAWNGELILFGDKVDGVVNYGTKYALSNLNISTPTASGISPICPPLLSGSDLIFIKQSGNYSNLCSYEIDTVTSVRSAEAITETYLGRYIPKNVKRICGPAKGLVAIFSTETRDKIYVMTYAKKAQRLVQQAVVTWDFSNVPDLDILDVSFDDEYLIVIYGGPGGKYYVGRLDTSLGAQDTGFARQCYLDHRMTDTGTYNSSTGRTTFALPYALTDGDKRAVILTESGTRYAIGENLTIDEDNTTDSNLVIGGDLTGCSIFAGYGYLKYFIPNPINEKTFNPSTGQRASDLMAESNLVRIAVGFFNTQYLKVELISRFTGRTLSEREFIGGLRLDNGYARLDDNVTTFTGILLISGENASVEDSYIRVSSSSHLPFFVDMIQYTNSSYNAGQ